MEGGMGHGGGEVMNNAAGVGGGAFSMGPELELGVEKRIRGWYA
jgi:hypothetical protein